MKIKEVLLKILKTTKSKILLGVIIVLFFGGCLLFIYNGKSTVDTEQMNLLLSKASELTTAKLNITAISEFKDTGIAFINKSDFIMLYTATIHAGINVEEVEIKADNVAKKIYISIPKAEIQEAIVDSKSIKYFDEKFALFNVDEKEDSNRAVALAEEAAKKEAANTGIIELANQQSATLIKGILANAIPSGYKIEIKGVE